MKKLLLSLFVGLVGLINFGYSQDVTVYNISSSSYSFIVNNSISYNVSSGSCFQLVSSPSNQLQYVKFKDLNNNLLISSFTLHDLYCTNVDGVIFKDGGYASSNINFYYFPRLPNFFTSNCPTIDQNYCTSNGLCPSCPSCPSCPTCDDPYTSLECQQEYDLIPISSVDQNYCTNNNLCPIGSGNNCPVCPEGSGDNWSALYINDIQHLGKPIINITFPDYLDWDYTTTDNEFNLDIVGYPFDTEYIDGIIRTQNYKPTSEDFTQLVGMLASYSKYLLFLLFIFIIWAWIKKPFKSKKL